MDSFTNHWATPPRPTDDGLQMDLVAELHDGGFEPQTRARSNTWPCPRPENFVEPIDDLDSTKASNQQLSADSQQTVSQTVGASKKNSSRRNAWGNLSYADLITHAIGSSTDKRLTLSQIYEWMVQNVPYFKDKGDSNSSAGWKNSIRHNLSLHNRFMRVQNEGTGKSSWWMLNPDAKPGKSVRRRAASMETSKYEKRRGRAKKRVEALRNAGATGLIDATPSPSSSVSEGLDHFPESPLHSNSGFQLSPDFRQRASSNASSCGRLSPIPAMVGLEPDWGFPADYTNTSITPAQANALDQLAGSLADDLTLQKDFLQGFTAASGIPNQPPPPYQPPQQAYSINSAVGQSYGMQQNQCPIHHSVTCTCLQNSREGLSPSSGNGMSPAYPNSEPSSDSLNTYNSVVLDGSVGSADNSSIINAQQQQQLQQSQQRLQQQQLSSSLEENEAKKEWCDQFCKELEKCPKNNSQDCDAANIKNWQNFTSSIKNEQYESENYSYIQEDMQESLMSILCKEESNDEIASKADEPASSKDSDGQILFKICKDETSKKKPFINEGKTWHLSLRETPLMCSTQSNTPEYLPTPRKRKITTEIKTEENVSDNENSIFFDSLPQLLKNMTPAQQLRIKTKFQEVLMDEMSDMQQHSLPSNSMHNDLSGNSGRDSSISLNVYEDQNKFLQPSVVNKRDSSQSVLQNTNEIIADKKDKNNIYQPHPL